MLTLTQISKSYTPSVKVLDSIDLSVDEGEIACLLGPSGCGKTTLLRIVAGLDVADQGEIRWQGRDLAHVPVHQRHFGFMFQDFALFPHRTVAQNIGFGLRMAGGSKSANQARVDEMLALVNLAAYGERSIFELSGGERQRVALARSLAPNPSLLMLDEPLGSLDRALREELMSELRRILKQVGVTALYVTHDQQEAYAVADQIVLMHQGKIVQHDAPQAIYAAPANLFAARFLGFANLLAAEVEADKPQVAQTVLGPWPLAASQEPGHYTLLIRPDSGTLLMAGLDEPPKGSAPDPAATIRLRGRVIESSFRGAICQLKIEVDSGQGDTKVAVERVDKVDGEQRIALTFELPTRLVDLTQCSPGQWVTLAVDSRQVSLL